jgi:GxxExxY protein
MTTTERHDKVLAAAKSVHARLGKRQSVECYESELAEELRMQGIGIRDEKRTQILFGRVSSGAYLADLLIDGNTLIEIKRAPKLTDEEKSGFARFVQEIRYQRGYLMNFAADDLEVAHFPPAS